MRTAANLLVMSDQEQLDAALTDIAEKVVPAIRRAYAVNASRHDPAVGDDSITFGNLVYRNSWFFIEEAVAGDMAWQTSRPDQSLLITDGHYRFHVYRCGADEHVDLNSFSLDSGGASHTKYSIAASNSGVQLAFDLFPSVGSEVCPGKFSEFVIVHAGNPDDACCSVWVGVPTTRGDAAASPWAWIRQLWQIQRVSAPQVSATEAERSGHRDLPEPELDVQLADESTDDAAAAQS